MPKIVRPCVEVIVVAAAGYVLERLVNMTVAVTVVVVGSLGLLVTHEDVRATLIIRWPQITKPRFVRTAAGTGFVIIVIAMLASQYLSSPPPSSPITLKDIADFASDKVMAVSLGNDPNIPGMLADYTGTGFWIGQNGYAATCLAAVQVATENRFKVGLPIRSTITSDLKGPEVSGGLVSLDAQVTKMSLNDKIAIIQIPGFKQAMGFKIVLGKNTPTLQEHFTFPLSPNLPDIGDRVFLYGVEQGKTPRFDAFEGHIIGLGAGPGLSAYTNLPFRETYCGAPIINESKSVIGMIVGKTSTGDTEIALARPVLQEMARLGLK